MSAVEIPQGSGDCYSVAAELILDLPDNGVWLCHGRPRYQGRAVMTVDGLVVPGDRYDHAWVETATTVFDVSNGKQLIMPIDRYYLIGAIAHYDVKRYTRRQAAAMMNASGHYGPWEDVE